MRHGEQGGAGWSARGRHGLILGCWQFAGGSQWGEQPEAASVATVEAALAGGITVFDTAPGYGGGESERILGAALRGRREEARIATKISTQISEAAGVRESVERSLRLLGTDRIDLLQLHWPNRRIEPEAMAGAVAELKAEGKVLAFGVCNFGPLDLADYLAAGLLVESNQVPYSLLTRAIEEAVLPVCQAHEIGVLAYSPLQQGLLTGKFRNADEVPASRARSRHFRADRPESRHQDPGCEAETFAAIAAIAEVAGELGLPMGRLALAWVLARKGVTGVIVGARNPQQVTENLQALELSLDTAVVARLDALTAEVKERLGPNPDPWLTESRYR